ncbi:MAG: hypothetical protein QW452_04040 [Pyrobaculum sp.]
MASKLWERARELREVWEGVKKADPTMFKTPVEFVDWFKAAADPVLQFHYEIGKTWATETT